jgi:hypothetical protein
MSAGDRSTHARVEPRATDDALDIADAMRRAQDTVLGLGDMIEVMAAQAASVERSMSRALDAAYELEQLMSYRSAGTSQPIRGAPMRLDPPR